MFTYREKVYIINLNHIDRSFTMSNKKTKIIELDESILKLIRKYQDKQGIKTFAGAVREMIESQLIDHQLMDTKDDDDHTIFAQQGLSEYEQDRWNHLNHFMNNYQKGVDSYFQLEDESKEHKTFFDYIASHYNGDNLSELVTIFDNQYIKLGHRLYRIDVVMKNMLKILPRYCIQIDTLKRIGTLKDINMKKELIRVFDDVLEYSKAYGFASSEYDKCIKKIHQYKKEDASLYDLFEIISDALERTIHVKGVL